MRITLAAAGLATLLALTSACTEPKEVNAKPSTSAAAGQDGGESPDATETPEGAKVTTVGQWAKATDGIEFRVSKLARGTVSDTAAGADPGDPAVVATVQIRNGSAKRFDLSGAQVTARLGEDGQESEQVFQDNVGDGFTGALAPGRTVTERFMFGAKKAADLKKVSIEVSPGFDYNSFTFEGGA